MVGTVTHYIIALQMVIFVISFFCHRLGPARGLFDQHTMQSLAVSTVPSHTAEEDKAATVTRYLAHHLLQILAMSFEPNLAASYAKGISLTVMRLRQRSKLSGLGLRDLKSGKEISVCSKITAPQAMIFPRSTVVKIRVQLNTCVAHGLQYALCIGAH
jgi:hypothetical protein